MAGKIGKPILIGGKFLRWANFILCLAALLSASLGKSEEIEGLHASVAQAIQYDDNLFRLPEGERAPRGNGQKHDRITTTTLAGRYEKTYSLQHVVAEASAARSDFYNYDYLDYTAKKGSLLWNWAAGRQWLGAVSLSQSQTLRGFENADSTERSINTYRRAAVDANYRWHPDWSAGVGVANVVSEYSDSESSASEYEEEAVELKVNFRPSTLNLVSLVISQRKGRYPGRDLANLPLYDSGYTQHDLQVRFNWLITGRSRFSGYIGGTERSYPKLAERDFKGLTGRVHYSWQATGKLDLNLILRRELGAEIDLVDNFVVTESLAISPEWKVTSKLALSGGYTWRQRSFGGDPSLGVVSRFGKDDRTQISRLSVDYLPTHYLAFRVEVQHEERISDNAPFDYTASSASVVAKVSW